MLRNEGTKYSGQCACQKTQYRFSDDPLIVHCCHCFACQRQTGSAFAVNALIETSEIKLLAGTTESVVVPTPSGKGQSIVRCKSCKTAVWSHYDMGGLGDLISFVRVGTLNNPAQCRPDIHIYTSSKQPWMVLPPTERSVEEYYAARNVWSERSQARFTELKQQRSHLSRKH